MLFNFTVKEFIIGNGTPTLQFYKRGFNLGGSSQPTWQDVILHGTTALTLVNAKADSLEYLKLFGGTEQRNLPSGYTQVEYLESSGTQYIDTGINDITNSEFEVVAQQTSITCAFPTIMGALDLDSKYKVICGLSTSNNTFYSQCGGPNGFIVSSVPNDTQKHTFKVTTTTNQQTLQIDDTAVVIGNYAITSTTAYPLTICARNKDTVSNFTNQKVFSVRIKKSGTLVCNLIPARRNSDNVLGMYDTVTGNFLTNAGTGTFTAGADVTPSPDTPMDIICNNGVVKAFKTLNISTYDTSASDAGIDIAFDDATDRRRWNTLNDNGTGTKHYENGFVSIYMDSNGYTYYAKALVNGVVYDGSVYNTGEQIYTWNYTIAKNIDIYCPTINVDGTTETVEITGKNLFDKGQTYIPAFVNANTGVLTEASSGQRSFVISCLPNTTYTLSGMTAASAWGAFTSSTMGTTATSFTAGNGTITTGANDKYLIGMAYLLNSGAYDYRNTLQIELGSTATTYEPYYNGGTATAERLLKVGTYQDEQSVIDGEVTRKVGIKVLDGTENWQYASTQKALYLLSNINATRDYTNAEVLCNQFKALKYNPGSSPSSGDCVFPTDNGTYGSIAIRYTEVITSVQTGKAWLASQYNAGTPVIIVYPLAEPTTETVTAQPMNIQEGSNTVSIVQASMDGLELKVKYKATL